MHPNTSFLVSIYRFNEWFVRALCTQSFLSATKEPAQVRMVLAELEPEMGSLLKQRRGGVVAALVAATGRLGSAQKEACKVRR